MKIGIVDLDTSHPQNWIPIERELGHDLVGLWDGGAVHPPPYVTEFAAEHSIPRVFESLEDMAAEVDCAVIHGCDWDTHVDRARVFVEAGKAVLVDKPLAGNLSDLEQLRAWANAGVRICGGSSLRFCAEARAFWEQTESERGTPHTVFAGCGVDEFNYGIHAYALLSALMGPGAERVRHVDHRTQRRIEITWPDGRTGIVMVGAADQWLPFHATVVTERSVHQVTVDSGHLYRALLEETLPYLGGRVDQPPMPFSELMEPELCALAAKASWEDGNREVSLDQISEVTAYDGAGFAHEYQQMRYPPQPTAS